MPVALGFRAWISTDDEETLEEYGTKSDEVDGRITRTWVPSEAGKKFKICWQNVERQEIDTDSSMEVDGIRVGGKFCKRGNPGPVVKNFVRTSETSCRQFIFAPLAYTDNDDLFDESSAQGLGEIRLHIYKARIRKSMACKPMNARELSGKGVIHEKLKKGLVHSVGFTAEMELQKRKTTRRINRGKKLATFAFMYQSIGVLQANGIAPPTPLLSITSSSDPSCGQNREMSVIEVDDDSNFSDSDDEVKELVFLRSRVRQFEKKRTNTKRVKTETDFAFLPGEVIDLTQDN